MCLVHPAQESKDRAGTRSGLMFAERMLVYFRQIQKPAYFVMFAGTAGPTDSAQSEPEIGASP